MPATNKIRSVYPSLPSAERRVADFILDNPEQAMHMVINEIADAAKVSVPSVTRLAKRLGYKGFLQFRVALAGGVAAQGGTQKISPITHSDSDFEVIDKLCGYSIASLEETCRNIKKDELCAAAKGIATRSRVFVYCRSVIIAQDAAMSFLRAGIPAVPLCDESSVNVYSRQFCADDVLLVLNSHNKSKELVAFTADAAAKGALIITVSSYENKYTTANCHHFFPVVHTPSARSHFRLDSCPAAAMVINVLISLAARMQGGEVSPSERK